MKTAVEWLVEELTKNGHNFKLYKKEIEQAKEMEKQQGYSEEDMVKFSEWVTIMYPNQIKLLTTSDKRGFYSTKELLSKWVEQFKKK